MQFKTPDVPNLDLGINAQIKENNLKIKALIEELFELEHLIGKAKMEAVFLDVGELKIIER
jgi:hypothetical protein